MLWLGIGEGQKIAIVFMGSWIYILLYTIESTKRVDPLLIRAARNLGAGDLQVMLHVILPGALPGIVAALQAIERPPRPEHRLLGEVVGQGGVAGFRQRRRPHEAEVPLVEPVKSFVVHHAPNL